MRAIILLLLLVPTAAAAERFVLVDRELVFETGTFTFDIPHGVETTLIFCYAGQEPCVGFGGTPTPLAVRRGLDACVALPTVDLGECTLRAKNEDSVAEVVYSAYWPVRFLAIGSR